MNPILQEDIDNFSLPEDLINDIRNTTFIVTGSTGLLGASIVRLLTGLNIGIKFVLPVRNAEKFHDLIGIDCKNATVIEADLTRFFETYNCDCDYIIHCASPTNGAYMQAHPVECFTFAVDSTRAVLEYCRRHPVRSCVYLSSIEYYGQLFNDEPVRESDMGFVDRQSARNSYALGKQACEFLCFSFANEYNVPVKSARLTQTFGAGISTSDSRVFAQFARSVLSHSDIVLHTEGNSAKPYVYITDCVAALLYIMLRGDNGDAYNVATPSTYVSIRELAQTYRDNFAPDINVVVDTSKGGGYAAETRVNLDASKLSALGWKPQYHLVKMIERLIDYLKYTD